MERHRLKRRHTTSLRADQNRFWLSTAVHKVEIHYAQRTSDHLSEEFLSPYDVHTPWGWHKSIVWMAAPPPQRTAQPGCTLSKQEHPVPPRCGQRATGSTPTPDRRAGAACSRACRRQARTRREGGSSTPSTGRSKIGDPSATQTDGSDGSDRSEAQESQEGLALQTHTECSEPLLFSAPPPAAVARWCRRCAAAAAATGSASSRRWCGWPDR